MRFMYERSFKSVSLYAEAKFEKRKNFGGGHGEHPKNGDKRLHLVDKLSVFISLISKCFSTTLWFCKNS